MLEQLGQANQVKFALRTKVLRDVTAWVKRMQPPPSPAKFVADVAAGLHKGALGAMLRNDTLLKGAAAGTVKTAACATRSAQIVVATTCQLADAAQLKALVSSWCKDATTATSAATDVTAALGINVTATLGEAIAAVRELLKLGEPLSAAQAELPGAAAEDAVEEDAGDVMDDEGADGEGGSGDNTAEAAAASAAAAAAAEAPAVDPGDAGFGRRPAKLRKAASNTRAKGRRK